MMKLITTALGGLMCLVAAIGFANNNAFGMVLTPLHNIMLLVIGAVTIYFGVAGTEFQARNCCRVLGVVFSILGIVGFLTPSGVATAGEVTERTTNLFQLIPNQLEFTTNDHILNMIIGVVGLVMGFFPREKEIMIDMKAAHPTEKIPTTR